MTSERPEQAPTIDPVGDAAGDTAIPEISFSENPAPNTSTSPALAASTESPPPKPPRPLSSQQQAQATLREAFPSIDAAVVRAVLVASGGQIEPAFTALLTMSDPTFVEEIPPPQPPRPAQRTQVQPPQPDRQERRQGLGGSLLTSTPLTQLEADEIFARQLAGDYGAIPRNTRGPRGAPQGEKGPGGRGYQAYHDDSDLESDKEHSFLDDDLPVIKENLRQGFLETQNKVNSWISDFKKRLDGDSPGESPPSPARSGGQYSRPGTRRTTAPDISARGPRDGGYDADPRVLSDDFTHLELRDNSLSVQAPQPRRPKPNPGLFQSSGNKPAGRKVSFDERPTTISDDDLYRAPQPSRSATGVPPRQPSPPASSKWEPLKSVEPAPMDRDPFSLGDSDDEKEGLVKETEPTKPISMSSAQETGITAPKETQ